MPEIVPSTFEENLPKSEFTGEAVFEYPVQTGSKKVCLALFFSSLASQDSTDANTTPGLLRIAPFRPRSIPTTSGKFRSPYSIRRPDHRNPIDNVFSRTVAEREPGRSTRLCHLSDTVVVKDEVIMEKPTDQQDNLRMLADLNGGTVSHPRSKTIPPPSAPHWHLNTDLVSFGLVVDSARSLRRHSHLACNRSARFPDEVGCTPPNTLRPAVTVQRLIFASTAYPTY